MKYFKLTTCLPDSLVKSKLDMERVLQIFYSVGKQPNNVLSYTEQP